MYICKKYIIYIYVCVYTNIYIYWSKPGSINTPQKQDENRGFGPGPAGGRTPGKLGGNVPVKLAKMRGKKSSKRVEMLPQKAQPGTNINYLSLFASKLGCARHYFKTPGAYRVFIIVLAPAKLTVKGLQRPAPRMDWTSWLRGPWFQSKAAQPAAAPQASSAELTIQLKTVLEKNA